MTTHVSHSTLLVALGATAVLSTGCGGDQTPIPCRDGTTLAADGHCYAANPATVLDALLALPECEPVSLNGNLDFASGCVGTGCVGMTFEQLNGAFEEYAPCTTVSTDTVECSWSLGVTAGFEDDDNDLVPDNDSVSTWFSITDSAAGASLRGTGVGASPRCAVDELGTPDYVSLSIDEGTTRIRYLAFDSVGAYFYDLEDVTGAAISDGILEEVYLVLR